MSPIKVLIVDDSAIVRQTLEKELSADPGFEVVGTAPDPYIARDKIVALAPDVMTLDIEMPRMDGLTFLRKLMKHHPIPVVVVSSIAQKGSDVALEAVRLGAVEALAKPGPAYAIGDMGIQLREKLRSAASVDINRLKNALSFEKQPAPKALVRTTDKVFVVGASTGGTQALELFVSQLPPNAPGTVIVQHMPAGFTKSFSERLNSIAAVEVKEAEDQDSIVPGKVLIAPGNFHMMVQRSGAKYFVKIKEGPLVGRHRPAVDVLFKSAAAFLGKNAVGILLTGMGKDGAEGMVAMKDAGAQNIVQDEASCVVYGMPKAAADLNAHHFQLPLQQVCGKALQLALEG
ncbi:chemotaxis response regulator protein-glutamate methylesterase [bacterium]|nr:chemotaxis response regulator protein-glutamate methylesterase [bacterium]